jgi:hypothetical protein
LRWIADRISLLKLFALLQPHEVAHQLH